MHLYTTTAHTCAMQEQHIAAVPEQVEATRAQLATLEAMLARLRPLGVDDGRATQLETEGAPAAARAAEEAAAALAEAKQALVRWCLNTPLVCMLCVGDQPPRIFRSSGKPRRQLQRKGTRTQWRCCRTSALWCMRLPTTCASGSRSWMPCRLVLRTMSPVGVSSYGGVRHVPCVQVERWQTWILTWRTLSTAKGSWNRTRTASHAGTTAYGACVELTGCATALCRDDLSNVTARMHAAQQALTAMRGKLGRREELLRQIEGLKEANAELLQDAAKQEAVVADLDAQRAQRVEYVPVLVFSCMLSPLFIVYTLDLSRSLPK